MVNKKTFGKTSEGKQVDAYTITNAKNESVTLLNYGGAIQAIKVLDKKGGFRDVALGYGTAAEYEKNSGYIGALIGRYANRIGKGRFTLNGKEYKLFCNDGENHLHGGKTGFDKKIWDAEISGNSVVFNLKSPDGEEGYPGNLTVKTVYGFNDNGELSIEYTAECDADTVINLTNHAYFNLNGEGSGDVLGQKLKIYAAGYTETDNGSIPTGKIVSVSGTPFDFREFKEIGKDIKAKDLQLEWARGFDENFVLDSKGKYALAAEAYAPQSGILMQVYTNKEGLQFYSGNYLDGKNKGKSGTLYNKNNAFCLETQHFPDSINKPGFPSPVLKKGKIYNYKTVYKFSVK